MKNTQAEGILLALSWTTELLSCLIIKDELIDNAPREQLLRNVHAAKFEIARIPMRDLESLSQKFAAIADHAEQALRGERLFVVDDRADEHELLILDVFGAPYFFLDIKPETPLLRFILNHFGHIVNEWPQPVDAADLILENIAEALP